MSMKQQEVPSRQEIDGMLVALNNAHKAYHNGRTQEARVAAKSDLNSCKKWFQDREVLIYFSDGYKPQWKLDPTYLQEQESL